MPALPYTPRFPKLSDAPGTPAVTLTPLREKLSLSPGAIWSVRRNLNPILASSLGVAGAPRRLVARVALADAGVATGLPLIADLAAGVVLTSATGPNSRHRDQQSADEQRSHSAAPDGNAGRVETRTHVRANDTWHVAPAVCCASTPGHSACPASGGRDAIALRPSRLATTP